MAAALVPLLRQHRLLESAQLKEVEQNLASRFPDAQTFTLTTRTSAGVDLRSRMYTSISAARADGDNARVWGGMHYPSTVTISDGVGEAIANYVNLNAMRAVRGSQK